jgi:hypothetical protein
MQDSGSPHDVSDDRYPDEVRGAQQAEAPAVPAADPSGTLSWQATFDDAEEGTLVAGLRRGDEAAFETLIDRHHSSLIRLARVWIRDPGVAEEVV